MEVRIKSEPGFAPVYQSGEAAGADLSACIDSDCILTPGQRSLIPTGVWIELPHGYEAQVRPRSGLAIKQGVTTLNSPGTIDSDYRGEIKVILINHSDRVVTVSRGDRIAQLVIAPVIQAQFVCVNELNETNRNSNGFGSTGVRRETP
ncbi:MAG: dUTP diphosphatase [Spirochaetales bacterium]|nr:dUTP diphosphatase [Spirochaetales bacterium]